MEKRPKRIWGLDLAGLGGRQNTGLAYIETDGISDHRIDVTVVRNHPFNKGIPGNTRWDDTLTGELVRCLKNWSNKDNHLYVDIPIDWQILPEVPDPLFVWQTKKRVVDYIFGGLAPFAQRVGSQTADFRFLAKTAEIGNDLGTTLFETYPKATLKAILEKYPSAAKNTNEYQRAIHEGLNIQVSNPQGHQPLDHDEIDAIVCAIVGASEFHSLTEAELIEKWDEPGKKRISSEKIREERPDFFIPPVGYRVLPPAGITREGIPIRVTTVDWSI